MTGIRALRVLESFPEPRRTTNPYIVQLAQALRATPGIELLTYSPTRAVFARYDVFHVHWPENLIGGHRRLGRVARRLHSAVFFTRLTLGRVPVVRTWHNLERPAGLGRIDNALLDWLDRLTTLRIRLNDSTEADGERTATIFHGHYRDWYAPFARADRTPGRIAYVGLVRPYKGVDALISAFVASSDPALSLSVAGRVSDDAHAAEVRALAHDDARVSFDLRYVDEADLVSAISAAELVALPYRHLHNSGSVLAALSLDRPVLVPDAEVTRRLGDEVGEDWVIRYRGELTTEILEDAAARVRTLPSGGTPDLGLRGWAEAGEAHRAAFDEAVTIRRGR